MGGYRGTHASFFMITVAAMTRPITVMNVATWKTSTPLVFSPRPSGTPETHLFCHPYSRAVQDALIVLEAYVRVEARVRFPQSLLSYRACEATATKTMLEGSYYYYLLCRHISIGVGSTLDPNC